MLLNKNYLILFLLFIVLPACGPKFDDPIMSELKKPEIISIILNPPMGEAGDIVQGRLVFADGKGPLPNRDAVWMVGADESDSNSAMPGPAGQVVEFEVPDLPEDAFNKDGLAYVSVMVAMLDKQGAVNEDQMGMRTLTVTNKKNQNWSNPKVEAISGGKNKDPDPSDKNLVFAWSGDPNFDEERQAAADNPFEIEEGKKVYFDIGTDVEVDRAYIYQWISTGGSFEGFREQRQPYVAPEYIEPVAPLEDLEGNENVNVRKDPNLHPVWAIVRDDWDAPVPGQSIAEFYVRIIPTKK